MAKQALIFSIRDDDGLLPEWAEMLESSEIAVWSHSVRSDLPPEPVKLSCGIVLVDLVDVEAEQVGVFVDQSIALRKKLGFADARVPMVAIASDDVVLAEDQLSAFADILKPPLTQDLVANRLTSLMRLATMRREAERRARTFKRFGVGLPVVPPPRDLDKQCLLFVGSGAAFLPIQGALPEVIKTVAALTPSMAEHYLTTQYFDALIVELSDYNEHLVHFISDLRRNSNFFSLPIILVCHKKAMADGLAGLAAGANDIVSFPFSERFFENRIDILVREERYRQQLRKIFTEARLLMPTDVATRLYSEEFLKAHLAVLLEQNATAGVTFVGFDLAFTGLDGTTEIQPSDALLSKVGRLISSLMRAEDLLARLDNGQIVAFLPDTDLYESRIALRRIRSIVQLNSFVDAQLASGVNANVDFSLHYCDALEGGFDADRILKDLFENPVTRF